MLLRLSKKSRDYVLKAEREGYWEKKIAKAEEDLAKTSPESDDYEQKKEYVKDLKEFAEKFQCKLEKYGSTIWKIHSVDRETIKREMARANITIGKTKGTSKDDITSGALGYVGLMNLKIVKLGLDGWENLIDFDSGKEVPFDKELIGQIPDDIITELSNEISGVIDDEDLGN